MISDGATPFVTPELERMAKRAALPVRAEYYNDTTIGDVWCITMPGKRGRVVYQFGRSTIEATCAYLSMCASLESQHHIRGE